jgi:formate C-acetyltransferase
MLEDKKETADSDGLDFISRAQRSIDAVYDYCDRLKEASEGDLKKALENVPRNKPQNYHEALVFLKLCIYTLRLNRIKHVTLARFDQYMYPYYKMDIERGVTNEEILELTEEFFLSINFDTDIYTGVQQGDNGQSLMLGGFDANGNDMFNALSEICMKASMELNLIDPKINLRVSKKTPFSRLLMGTEMTKLGLGFPQYNNDDIVVPGLIALGYSPEDAYNYSVAACWEFIVPDASDVPNIKTMNFPKVVNNTLHDYLEQAPDFESFIQKLEENIDIECQELLDSANSKESDFDRCCDAYFSLFFKPCVEKCIDHGNNGANYNNYGFHGTGIANAADALAAIKKLVFEDKTVNPAELKAALNANFKGYEELRNQLCNCPKMGNNDDYVDSLGCTIMDIFAKCLATKRNQYGGCIRPGTGSAMEYLWAAQVVAATADGRYAYTPFSSSFSPAITTRLDGPLSVIQSFTKYDMTKAVNGGPLTMEIHDTTFRNDQGVEKVAELVKAFIELGGQQLQLNSINRDRLLDAQKHPDLYPNLIVRVWGWSGYFNELEVDYQNHIIKRTEFQVS